jgi:hypothetical protein
MEGCGNSILALAPALRAYATTREVTFPGCGKSATRPAHGLRQSRPPSRSNHDFAQRPP